MNNTLQERFSQLESSIKDIFRLAYDPEKNGWDELDAKFRTIEEQICVVLTYAVFEDEDAEDILKENGKQLYGWYLVDKVAAEFAALGINTSILDKLKIDLSTHNENCHGSNIPKEERMIKGRANVFASLPILIDIFEKDLYSFQYTLSLKEEFKRLAAFLKYTDNAIRRPDIDPKVKAVLKEDVLARFSEAPTNSGEYHFCLLLPENPSKDLIERLRPLANIKWSIIMDEGYESGKVYQMWKEINPEIINNTSLTEKLDPNLTNWYFVNGRKQGLSKKEVRIQLNNIIRKPLPLKECIIVDLLTNKSKGLGLIERLWKMLIVPDDSEVSELSHIISPINHSAINELEKQLEDNDYEVASFTSVPMRADDFVEAAMRSDLFPSPIVFSDFYCLSCQEAYHRAGLRFLNSEDKYQQLSQWDRFYAGRPISTDELRQNADVHPRCSGNKDKIFEKSISESFSKPDSTEFNIVHQPAAGGSTIARRVAYNLFNEGKCLPIFINDLKAGDTIDMVKRVADSLGGVKRLLVITDDKYINATKHSDLRNRLRQASVFPIYLRIRHELTLDRSSRDAHTLYVAASLTSNQLIDDFDSKFRTYFSQFLPPASISETINKIHDVDKSSGEKHEMINYPYAFCERLLDKGKAYILMNKKDYVKKWFNSIKNQGLKDLCGYVALVYRFSASRSTDRNGLIGVWKSSETPTLQSYPPNDLTAIQHIIKQSVEEGLPGEKSTFWSPRYGSFAEDILNVWKSGWANRLSSIVVDFINSYNSILNDRDQDLFFDLFTQQSRINKGVATAGGSTIPFNDRFSLLIGFVLDSGEGIDGVRRIFNALIERYPDNAFYQLHFGRILFEYAHKEQVSYGDVLFADAEKLVTEARGMIETSDDCIHVVGMYWSRYAAALAREIVNSSDKELVELKTSLKEAIDKAYECFEECNDLNFGTSPYGYFSSANLMIKAVDWFKNINERLNSEMPYLETEECLGYLDILGYCTSELNRFSYEEDIKESLDFDRIQNKYLELLGDREMALNRAQDKFMSAISENMKLQYGHQFMSLCLTKNNRKDSQRNIFERLDPERQRLLTITLSTMADMGDLRAAEQLFNLHRYLNRDLLKSSKTTLALENWYALASEKQNPRHILRSSFYLYVCYAAQLIKMDSQDAVMKKKYIDRRAECRKLTEKLDEDPYRTWAFLGKNDVDRWSCILDPMEGMVYDKSSRNRIYSLDCRRIDALMTGSNGNQGDCESGELSLISFRKGKIPNYEIGKLVLKNGIIGFRYNGAGLYKFVDKYNSDGREEVEKPIDVGQTSEQKESVTRGTTPKENSKTRVTQGKKAVPSTEVVFKTETEQRALRGIKVVGRIDLDNLK